MQSFLLIKHARLHTAGHCAIFKASNRGWRGEKWGCKKCMLEPFSTHFCESPEEEKVATTRWYEKRETTDDFVRSTREKLARAQSSRPWPWRSSKATLHKSDGSLHSHEQFQAAAMPPGHILEEHNCSKSKGSSRLESLKLSLHLRDDAPWNTF